MDRRQSLPIDITGQSLVTSRTLDPVATQAEWLALAQAVTVPFFVINTAQAPPKSTANMRYSSP
ncbi:MAG: hypothetical protein F6J87_27270 [Spirulina sp. SIO3F2]|nr:hypothetical protein [Spirulina sp. SIO3F2]